MLRLALAAASHLGRGLVRLPREAAEALASTRSNGANAPGRLALALLIVVPLALAVRWGLAHIVIVMSPSIEAWAVTPAPGPIAKGDYVMFPLSHPLAGPTPVNVTKHALCLGGERLTMVERPSTRAAGSRDGYYYCAGKPLGISKPYGRAGQKLDHFHWTGGRIPPGQAYVGSANPDSFDSRYFGLVPIARLTRMRRIL